MSRSIVIEQAIARAATRAGRPLPLWLVTHLANEVDADLAQAAKATTEPKHEPLPDGTYLTKRQRQIAAMFADGLSNKEIGTRLYLTEDTVKTHSRRIYLSMGARDRAHAAALATRWGIAAPVPTPRKAPAQ